MNCFPDLIEIWVLKKVVRYLLSSETKRFEILRDSYGNKLFNAFGHVGYEVRFFVTRSLTRSRSEWPLFVSFGMGNWESYLKISYKNLPSEIWSLWLTSARQKLKQEMSSRKREHHLECTICFEVPRSEVLRPKICCFF